MEWSINHKGPPSSLERALSRYRIEEIQSKSLSVRQVTWLIARHRTSRIALRTQPVTSGYRQHDFIIIIIIIIISSSSSSSSSKVIVKLSPHQAV
jgi:hypothetical protein